MTQLNRAGAGAPKRKLKAGAKASAGAKSTRQKPKPKAKPEWDGFTSDLDRFKLPAEEQERKRAARKSKHMPSTSAAHIGQDPYSYRNPATMHGGAPVEAPSDTGAHGPMRTRAEPTYPLHKDAALDVSGREHSKLGHLDYRSIAKILQSKAARKSLQARGEAEPDPEQDSPRCKEGVVNFEEEVRDFLKRRVQEQKDDGDPHEFPPPPHRAEGSRGSPTRALEDEFMARLPPSGEKVHKEALEEEVEEEDEEDDEEGEDEEEEEEVEAAAGRSDGRASRLGGSRGPGYELTLRPQQELARFGAEGTGGSSSSGGGAAWEAWMQAAEERLRELEGLPRQVESIKEEMAALRSENQALSSEFTEFMSHTTTVLTKLQAQFAQLLSSTSRATTSSAAEPQPSQTGPYQQRSAAQASQPPKAPPMSNASDATSHGEADDRNDPPVARQPGSVPVPMGHRGDAASIGSNGGSFPSLPDPYRPKSRMTSASSPLGPADEQAQLPSFSRLRGESRSAGAQHGATLTGGLPQAWPNPQAGLPQAAAHPPFAKFPIPGSSRPAAAGPSCASGPGPSGFMMSHSGPQMPLSVSDRFPAAQNSLSLSKHAAAARSTSP